jgi:putative transposase
MARPLRIEYEGAFYHVTARGNERKRVFFARKRVFFAKADYGAFKGYLKEAKEKYGIRLRIPVQAGHPFHSIPATRSSPFRPLIPEQAGHLLERHSDAG